MITIDCLTFILIHIFGIILISKLARMLGKQIKRGLSN